jgi:hypothetical protein
VKEKLGAALICLAFALPFGGIGVGASWLLGRMLYDGQRAEQWVRVAATVDSYDHGSVSYRYKFSGVEYRGDRLGANPIGGTDDIDSWHDDMAAMINAAHDAGKPVTVWVNPENPSESMVDRTVRWKLAVFIVPFALGFGAVGIGALWMFFRTLFTPAAELQTRGPVATANKASAAVFLWIFAFMWNAISFPIALVVLPDAIAGGQWGAALMVSLFPLVGLLLVWGAIVSSLRGLRRKAARKRAPRAVAAAKPVNDGVFARGMIGDAPASNAAAAGAIGRVGKMKQED